MREQGLPGKMKLQIMWVASSCLCLLPYLNMTVWYVVCQCTWEKIAILKYVQSSWNTWFGGRCWDVVKNCIPIIKF